MNPFITAGAAGAALLVAAMPYHDLDHLARPTVPGAVLTTDPAVICERDHSEIVRPPENITEPYKMMLIHRLPLGADHRARDYELDDKMPIGVGGKPSPDNWWLQPMWQAKWKDGIENRAHREICEAYRDGTDADSLVRDWQEYFLNWPNSPE